MEEEELNKNSSIIGAVPGPDMLSFSVNTKFWS